MSSRVLHISYSDTVGGAARSAYRLHQGLRREGVDSRMLVQLKGSIDDPAVRAVNWSFWDRAWNRLQREVGLQYLFVPATLRLFRDSWVREARVLQLGNLHGGFFAYPFLPLLGRGKRLVWTLHDMWAFTGHCGYSLDSDRWLTGCGHCPHLDTWPSIQRDGTRINWRAKKAVYSVLDVAIVTPSRWLAALAERSPLLERFDVRVIPYGLDIGLFAPRPRAVARKELGLDPNAKLVLVTSPERRKGSDVIAEVIARARASGTRIDGLLVAGETYDALALGDTPVIELGSLDERGMSLAYAAADAFLLPTRMDNLPNTILEALACGAPVVAAASGGVSELIENGSNGLLAPLDAGALSAALTRILTDEELSARLTTQARARAADQHSLAAQARAYVDLYRELSRES